MARPNFQAVFNLAAVLCLWGTSSLAANISLSQLGDDPAHARVAVDGRFEAGDEIKFRTQVGRLTKAVVVFNSDGGNLQAGIEIGKTIRLKSFATAVLDGFRCASSCAFAWLGGSPRFMQRGAKIGFHAAYIENRGSRTESGVGNALVGSYLTQIGLPETAVIYVTKAAPTQLTLLTLQDAQRIGIEVLPFEQYAPTTEPAQRITPRGREELALDCGASQSTPRDNDPDPIYKTKIAVTDEVIYVEHYAASGKTFSRNEQYRDQKFWRGEKADNWSGVSVRRPDRTMVGSIRIDNGGQRAEYTERLYRGGKLEVTIVSMCRLIRTTAAPQTPPPAKPATPTRPEPSETSRRDSDVNTCSQGNSRDALDACSQLINLSGLNLGDLTIAYFRRAQLYFSNGDYDRAIADFSAFIRLRPNSVVAFNERGLSFGKKGDYDKAIADYTEAIRLNPVWSALPYYNRGTAYEKKGELEKALADFREALNKGSTTVSEDINRVEWAIESLRKEKSREIIWKNYPHLNGDDKRALAIYPEILPPPEYDYPRILINWLDGLTHEELAAYCNNPKAISPPTKTFVRDTLVGCARGERNPCRVYLAREDVITAAGLTLNLVKRHMIGRCNGWPDDHAGARRSTMMPRLHGPVVGEGSRVADPSGTPLNIRSSPKGGSIRGALSNDTVVKVLEVRGDWARIKPHGGCTQSILNVNERD